MIDVNTPETKRWPLGYPILFVHGMWHGDWCWSNPWREFFKTAGFRVDTMNLHGKDGTHVGGRSLRWTSLASYADGLVNKALGCESRPILIGHSLGALLIEMRLRQLNPPAAVLLAPTRPSVVRRTTILFALRHPLRFLSAQPNTRRIIHDRKQCRAWFFCDSTPQEIVDSCFNQLEEESSRVCLELLVRPKVVCRVDAGVPVLVLGAKKDGVVPERVAKKVASLHGTSAQFFDDMGHDMMLEPQWKLVADRIVRWLEDLKQPSRE